MKKNVFFFYKSYMVFYALYNGECTFFENVKLKKIHYFEGLFQPRNLEISK